MTPGVRRVLVGLLLVSLAVALVAALELAARRLAWEGARRQVSFALGGATLERLLEAGASPEALGQRFAYLVLDAAELTAFAPLGLEPWSDLRALEAPWDEATLAGWRQAGLAPVVVLTPLPVLDAPRLAGLREALARVRPAGVLFVDAGPRWPAASLQRAAAAAVALGAWSGTVEFAEPEGLAAVYRLAPERWARAHLISPRERAGLTLEATVARWLRAVRERSLRLLVFESAGDPLELLAEAQTASARLQELGFDLGPLPPLPPWEPAGWRIWLLTLGPWSATLGLFLRLWRRRRAFLTLAALTTAAAAGAAASGPGGREFLALSTAIVWPMALYRGLLLLDREGLGWALAALGGSFAASLVGGLVTAAFLSEPLYFLGLEPFRGVKLALIEPVLIVLFWDLRRHGPGIWRALWRRPLTWGEAALALVLLAGATIVLARSGNESFVPPLPGELRVRALLETGLGVRPRFKEFLVGYPLLLLWLSRGPRRWGLGGVAVLAGAFLAPVTVLNSFAHLHTPLAFTLARSAAGLALGALLGVILWRLARRAWS